MQSSINHHPMRDAGVSWVAYWSAPHHLCVRPSSLRYAIHEAWYGIALSVGCPPFIPVRISYLRDERDSTKSIWSHDEIVQCQGHEVRIGSCRGVIVETYDQIVPSIPCRNRCPRLIWYRTVNTRLFILVSTCHQVVQTISSSQRDAGVSWMVYSFVTI